MPSKYLKTELKIVFFETPCKWLYFICFLCFSGMHALNTETMFRILTSYVNYTNGGSVFTITITRCTYVWSCILPLYTNKMKQVTRGIELAFWDTSFCPGDVWMWITRCIACQCMVLYRVKIKLIFTFWGNSYFWRH